MACITLHSRKNYVTCEPTDIRRDVYPSFSAALHAHRFGMLLPDARERLTTRYERNGFIVLRHSGELTIFVKEQA